MRTRRPLAQRSAARKNSRLALAERRSAQKPAQKPAQSSVRSRAQGPVSIPATAPSSDTISQRRRALRRQRGVRSLKVLWRLLLAGGMAGGLTWGMGQPIWLVRSASQIQIKGNKAMSADTLRQLVPVDYPQSLLKIQPDALEAALLAQAPLLDARISRQIIPPGLIVKVKERQPVAVAELARPQLVASAHGPGETAPDLEEAEASEAEPKEEAQASPGVPSPSTTVSSTRVLLDANGEWVALDRYDNPENFFELPTLQVYGMRPEYAKEWQLLYRALSQSPVMVSAIDWREPANVKLSTDLGQVHVGPYGPQFSTQLEILDRMRNLSSYAEADQIAFIDLRTPSVPRLQMKTDVLTAESP